MAHPAIALADALVTALAAQSFAVGATVSWSKVPVEHLESVTDESRITIVLAGFTRVRTSRNTIQETVELSIATHRKLAKATEDSDIESMLGVSYDVGEFVNEWDAAAVGWTRTTDSDTEAVYSIEEIQKTGEFQSVVTQSFTRWVPA